VILLKVGIGKLLDLRGRTKEDCVMIGFIYLVRHKEKDRLPLIKYQYFKISYI